MTYPRAYGMVEYTGQRIHARLSVPISDVGERHRFFWYNSDWNSQGSMANPLNILVESYPPPIRPTGRTRMEKPHGRTDGEEIVCQEMEVLVPDEGLLRQCYYCLEWEEDNSPRFSRCGSNDDIYWCSSVRSLRFLGLDDLLQASFPVSDEGTAHRILLERSETGTWI